MQRRQRSVSRSIATTTSICAILFAVTHTSVLPSFTRTGTATLRGEDGGAGGTAEANGEPVAAAAAAAVAEPLLWPAVVLFWPLVAPCVAWPDAVEADDVLSLIAFSFA